MKLPRCTTPTEMLTFDTDDYIKKGDHFSGETIYGHHEYIEFLARGWLEEKNYFFKNYNIFWNLNFGAQIINCGNMVRYSSNT